MLVTDTFKSRIADNLSLATVEFQVMPVFVCLPHTDAHITEEC